MKFYKIAKNIINKKYIMLLLAIIFACLIVYNTCTLIEGLENKDNNNITRTSQSLSTIQSSPTSQSSNVKQSTNIKDTNKMQDKYAKIIESAFEPVINELKKDITKMVPQIATMLTEKHKQLHSIPV